MSAPGDLRAAGMLGRMTLGMPHLSPSGLAEDWVLREGGDRHWAMLSRAMGRAEGAFEDAQGRPLYAAFCATELAMDPRDGLGAALLGAELSLRSTLGRVSAGRIGSEHVLSARGRAVARLRMISAFVAHDPRAGRLAARPPAAAIAPPPAGPGLMALGAAAGREARRLRAAPPPVPQAVLHPCPERDFNAVGLLYFPAYSALAAAALRRGAGRGAGPFARVRARRVVYLGNPAAGAAVRAASAASGRRARTVLHAPCGAPLAAATTLATAPAPGG
ncbi:Pnap_2097 family protein [Rhodovulum sp. DZ06]|uniref:Pnap_2097 family protein n=1 Tax=Rhodovulum sp. DZ06 TaxID=3425126 RepID=UPI003D353E96